MTDWNPLNKKILYFHVVEGEDYDYYLKVDVESERFYKLVYKELPSVAKYKKGLVELKYQTFIGNYTHRCLNLQMLKHYEKKDGRFKRRMKYTTESQFIDALRTLLMEFLKT